MLLAARLALGPVLLHQGRAVRRTALRLPEAAGPRQGLAGAGATALRLLVVGDSSAAGVGLPHQSQALAQPLAQALAERLGGAVGWQLVAESGVDARGASRLLAGRDIGPADVVVTVLGVNDVTAQRSGRDYVAAMADLWSQVRRRTGARWAVLSGLPPMQFLTAVPQPLRWYLGRYAAGLDRALSAWAAGAGLGHCPLQWAEDPALLAPDGFHPGSALYPLWAQRLADLIVEGRARWAPPAPVRPEPVEGRNDSPESIEGPELVGGRLR